MPESWNNQIERDKAWLNTLSNDALEEMIDANMLRTENRLSVESLLAIHTILIRRSDETFSIDTEEFLRELHEEIIPYAGSYVDIDMNPKPLEKPLYKDCEQANLSVRPVTRRLSLKRVVLIAALSIAFIFGLAVATTALELWEYFGISTPGFLQLSLVPKDGIQVGKYLPL